MFHRFLCFIGLHDFTCHVKFFNISPELPPDVVIEECCDHCQKFRSTATYVWNGSKMVREKDYV